MFFLFLFAVSAISFTSARGAAAVTPQLAAGYDFGCLLGESVAHAAVRCWDPNGHELRVPELTAPSLLAATAHDVCAVDGGRVVCWEYRKGKRIIGKRGGYQGPDFVAAGDNFAGRVERAFAGYRGARFLSGGFDRDFCLVDSQGTLHCFGERQIRHYSSSDNKSHTYRDKSPLADKAPKLSGVTRLTLNGEMGCAITQDKKLVCWAGGSRDADRAQCAQDLVDKMPHLTNPLEIALPAPNMIQAGYGGFYNFCKACVIDGSDVRCWQGDGHRDDYPYPNEMRGLISPHGLLLEDTGSYPCVISGRKLVCLRGDLHGEDAWNRRYADLKGGTVLVARGATVESVYLLGAGISFCVANEERLRCQYYPEVAKSSDSDEESDANHLVPEFPHHLSLTALQDLRQELLGIVPRVYRPKAALFERLAGLLEKEYASGAIAKEQLDLFVMNAVLPIVETSSGDYFEKTVIPYFQSYLRRNNPPVGVKGVADFPRTEAFQTLTWKVLAAEVPLLQELVPQSPTDPSLPNFLAALGRALAAPASHQETSALTRAYAPIASRLAAVSDPRVTGLARSLADLMARVGPTS